jgi:hypothetical protein
VDKWANPETGAIGRMLNKPERWEVIFEEVTAYMQPAAEQASSVDDDDDDDDDPSCAAYDRSSPIPPH